MAQLIDKTKSLWTDITLHWRQPAKGNYVPYKETIAFSIGKFGQILAIALPTQFNLLASNIIIAQVLRVDPSHMQVMNIVATTVAFFFTMMRSNWVDNSRSKEGRFRPFMKYYGFPMLVVAFIFVWFPYDKLPDGGVSGAGYWMKVGIVLVLYIGILFFRPLYELGFGNLIAVMSPNSQERQDIYAVVSIVFSLAYSIYIPLITMISKNFPNRMVDIGLYRWAYIPICVIGLAISYVGYFGTKERIIQSRARVNKISVSQAFLAVAKNRNFWFLFIASFAGFLENNSRDLLDWAFNYQRLMSPESKVLIDMFINNSALWSMILTPILTRFVGKRFLFISTNVLNIFLLAFTYNTYNVIPLLAVFRFLNLFLYTMQDTLSPALDADIRDEQQYITGERIDGMFGLVSYAKEIIAMGTSFVTPWILKTSGIFKGNGGVDFEGNENEWFALRDKKVYDTTAKNMIIASIIGATANAIPLFFYNLTEGKQRAMTKVNKLRAMLEDFGEGIATPEQIVEAIDIVRQAREDEHAKPLETNKTMKTSEKLKVKNRNEDIRLNYYVLDELKKFETPEMKLRIKLAEKVYNAGLEGLYSFIPLELSNDKKFRAIEKEHNFKLKRAARNINKHYPKRDIAEPDLVALEALYDSPEETREQAKAKTLAIKIAEAERGRFVDCAKPWLDAKRLLKELENQENWDEIFDNYDFALKVATENERLAAEKARLDREQKRAETERLKLQRKAEKARRK